jgi:uncharacterized delta-60 repeat protein
VDTNTFNKTSTVIGMVVLFFAAFETLAAPGDVDVSFNPGTGAPDNQRAIRAIALQADGKIVIGGAFGSFNGTNRTGIARLNSDGSIDTSFNPILTSLQSFPGYPQISTLIVQTNGKVIIGGSFISVNATARTNFARLNSDGSLDITFNSGSGTTYQGNPYSIRGMVSQPDGKVVVTGPFDKVDGTNRSGIARLNINGSLDTGFDSGSLFGNPNLVDVPTLQPDGKILVCGTFSYGVPTTHSGIARLNLDGSLDAGFDPGSGVTSGCVAAVRPDGKIIIGGMFQSFNGTNINYLARLNTNGSLDTSFLPSPFTPSSIDKLVLQADGKIIVGGFNFYFNGTNRGSIARFNPDGSLDTTFTPPDTSASGIMPVVSSLAVQPDGKVLVGLFGDSVNYFGITRLSAPVLPMIAIQPQNITNLGNTTANISVTVSNASTSLFYYQWNKNGIPTGIATTNSANYTNTLTLANVSPSDSGSYTVVITNTAGAVTSAVATLTVIDPAITNQPVSFEECATYPATFSVRATGHTPLKYQWQKNGTNISGATASTYTISSLQDSDASNYTVVVTNGFGSITSSPAMLTVDPPYIFATLAGNQSAGTNDGTASAAKFYNPSGVAADVYGNVYVADKNNHTIRKITPAGVVITIAGKGGVSGSIDGAGIDARFNLPIGIAVDVAGNIYVADSGNHIIREISPSGTNWDVTTLAGSSGNPGSTDGNGTDAQFNNPHGVAVDTSNNVYVADYDNFTIRQIKPSGDVTTIAGLAGNSGSVDAFGASARFRSLYGVTVDASNNVFVADLGNHTIRKLSLSGLVTTIAGLASTSGSADGVGNVARFNQPSSVATDNFGNVFVTDNNNFTIRKISPNGTVVTIAGLAGSYLAQNGTGSTARFKNPFGLTIDGLGNIYVADTGNDQIQKGVSTAGAPHILTQPTNVIKVTGMTTTFTVGISGTAPFVYQWQKNGTNLVDGGNIFGSATNTLALSNVSTNDAANYTVVVTNSIGSITSIVASLTVLVPPSITVQPASQTNLLGNPVSFTVAAVGTPPFGYQWKFNNANLTDSANIIGSTSKVLSIGSIAVSNGGNYTVTVTNAAGSTNSTAAALTVLVTPTAPVFYMNTNAYSVLENGSNVAVTVVKALYTLAGNVNYSTANGSAVVANGNGQGDYQAVSGQLAFGLNETNKTVTIPIIDDPIYKGNRSFSFSLSLADANSSLGSPSSATVTIVEDDPPTSTNSFLGVGFPDAVPAHTGSLRVSLQPSAIGSQWRLAWETAWRNSDDVINGLPAGNFATTFKPVAGYLQPNDTTNPVTSGLTWVTNVYLGSGSTAYGSLQVNLTPSGVGQWRVQGETNWHDSGFVFTNLVAGSQIVEFKTVLGYDTPAARSALVGANQLTLIAATYLISASTPGTPASVLGFTAVSQPAANQPPYPWCGQLLSDVGYGSGTVVKKRVVLTAAHVVFNDATFTFVSGVNWFFQRHQGEYEPAPQNPRGWYVYDGYAAARTNDNSPGISSPTSQNLDVAALYFLEDAGRGGYSGYLASNPGGTEWLQASASKTLIGYPVEGILDLNRGKMHATTPQNLAFTTSGTNRLFYTTAIVGYPGMSGGPLCVQATNNIYYPAGIYLGGSGGQTTVRTIDAGVVDLVNRAENTAYTGGNNTGGGTALLSSGAGGSGSLVAGTLIIQSAFAPTNAGWRIFGTSNYFNFGSAQPIVSGSYLMEFRPVAGYQTPTNRVVQIGGNQTTIVGVDYLGIKPFVSFNTLSNLIFTGGVGATYRVEFTSNCNASTVWTPLVTQTLSGTSITITNLGPATNKARFYRVRLLP